MLPRDPAGAVQRVSARSRKLVTGYVGALQRLPVLAQLVAEAIDYDFRFPVERRAVEKELATLNSLTAEQKRSLVSGVRQNPAFTQAGRV
jgi:hypothetical protein